MALAEWTLLTRAEPLGEKSHDAVQAELHTAEASVK